MTSAEMYAKADALDAEARKLKAEAHALHREEQKRRPLLERLVFAAHSRCPCGAGLAYDPAHEEPSSVFKGPTFWDCSAILLGAADKAVKHTAQLPFAFYEVKAEGQPSACGATTRPPAAGARRCPKCDREMMHSRLHGYSCQSCGGG